MIKPPDSFLFHLCFLLLISHKRYSCGLSILSHLQWEDGAFIKWGIFSCLGASEEAQ